MCSEYIGLIGKTTSGVSEVAPAFSHLSPRRSLLPSSQPPANEPFPVFFRLIYGLTAGGAEEGKAIENAARGGEEEQVFGDLAMSGCVFDN